MIMICAAMCLCTVAPGGDPGCQVYVAGDTLARRERVEERTKLCRLTVLYVYVMLDYVFITWCIWGTAPV